MSLYHATSTTTHGNLAFTHGVHEAVSKNREVFFDEHDLPKANVAVMDVVHGHDIRIVDTAYTTRELTDVENAIPVDALITQEKGLALFLLTADCIPVTCYDPVREALALIHLGWKSTDQLLMQRVIAKMRELYGSHPLDLRVTFGPAIQKSSYAFSPPLDQSNSPSWQPFLEEGSDGKIYIDNVGYAKAQCLEASITSEHLTIDPTDTATSTQYFSHYRSARTGEPEGRFATVAMLRA